MKNSDLVAGREIGIGFIGAGGVSTYHALGVQAHENARLIGVYDIAPERAKERAELYKCEKFESAEQLVSDPRIDAVFVLTPLEAHFPNAKLALERGKHVLVEKPVGVTVAEIEELKRLSEKNGLVCMPGHNNIYDPGVGRIKTLIDRGDLGKLSAIYILYNIHHPEEVAKKYPGVIRQVGTHHCYTLLYLSGKPRSVQAMKQVQHYQEYDQEDIFMANFEMENGALAHTEVGFVADDHTSDPWSLFVKVIGTDGAARFSHNDWVVNREGIVHSHTYVAYPETIKNEDAHFMACVRGENQPLSTLDDAVTAQKMIEAIEQSTAERRTINL